jgi:hypothetical protein
MSLLSDDFEGIGGSSDSEFVNKGKFCNPLLFQSDGKGRSNSDGCGGNDSDDCGGDSPTQRFDYENFLHNETWHWPPPPVPHQRRGLQQDGATPAVGATAGLGCRPSIRHGLLRDALPR